MSTTEKPVPRNIPAPGIIATIFASRQQPQAGQMLAQLRQSRNWTQKQLAEKLGVERTTITLWETGVRWPQGDTLQRLTALTIGENLVADANLAAQEIASLIDVLSQSGADQLQIAEGICTYAYPKVLASLALKSCGIGADSRCISLFFDHRKEVVEEMRRNGEREAKNVSPKSAAWSTNPYQAPQRDASEPDDVYSLACETPVK